MPFSSARDWVRRLNRTQAVPKPKFPAEPDEKNGRGRFKLAFLIDSDAELFMYLIELDFSPAHEKIGIWTRPKISTLILVWPDLKNVFFRRHPTIRAARAKISM